MARAQFSVLMVCMGNICRSPTAEGVFRRLVREAGLAGAVRIDSAGTLDYHAGSPPDHRAQHHAARRGYDLSQLRARQVSVRDFEDNLSELQALCPAAQRHKVKRLMEFAPQHGDVVPDPYYGGKDGFERVLDQVEQACRALLVHVRERLGAA
jgi:protein-tyrosine phosphatase